MAGQKFFVNILGKIKELAGIQSSAGAGDAGKIPALDSAGKLDITMMPTGVTAEVTLALASEDLAAGDFVNFHLAGGVLKARKADATTNAKPADGFVLAAFLTGATASVYGISNANSSVAGLTIASDYWLSITPGAITGTAPSAAGNIVQRLGKAKSATEIIFENQDYYELS